MSCVLIAVVLVAIVVVLTSMVVGNARAASGQWNRAFEHVARRFHGHHARGGFFGQPSAWIRHGEASGRLTIFSLPKSPGERCLQMTMQQSEFPGKCEIFYHLNRPALSSAFRGGLSQVQFDWEGFRDRWHVLAADGDEARHLLTDGVRLAIDHVWRQPVPGEVSISLSPGWIVVRKVWQSSRGIDLAEFVERVCNLADQLSLAAAAGIEFVESDEAQIIDDAQCAICRDSLTHEIVVCRRCNTPHHRDCWEYSGGCSTYGCGSRDCVLPGIAPLAGPHWTDEVSAEPRPLKPR